MECNDCGNPERYSGACKTCQDRKPAPDPTAEEFARCWIDGEKTETRYSEIKALQRLVEERDAQLIASTLQSAADRHCTETCRPKGYSDDDYHCRTCPDRKAILAPLDEKKEE